LALPATERIPLLVARLADNNGTRGIDEVIRLVTRIRQGLCNWPTRLALAGFIVLLLAGGTPLSGQQPTWKTGTALRKQLETPLSLVWGQREVREAVASLANSTGVAMFLDRRIDPSRTLDLTATDESLKAVLQRVAERFDGGDSLVGSVVYIGPKETAGKLATLAALRRQSVGEFSATVNSAMTKSEPLAWDDLAEPRTLLVELAKQGGVTIENPEAILHDLWPASQWPAMPWPERMTLLLAGFNLTYEPAGPNAIRLVPIPEALEFEKSYTPRGSAEKAAADLKRLVPAVTIVVAGGSLRVAASAEDHERIDRLLRGESVATTKVTPGQKRYTLTVENQPAGAVVKTIAGQLGKELTYDPAVVEKLRTKVSFTVKDVPLEELMAQTLGPLGLTYRIEGPALVIAIE
jgi:hypothetical protein